MDGDSGDEGNDELLIRPSICNTKTVTFEIIPRQNVVLLTNIAYEPISDIVCRKPTKLSC